MPHSLGRDYAELELMIAYSKIKCAAVPKLAAKPAPRFRFEVQAVKYPGDFGELAELTQDYCKLGDAKLRMMSNEYVRATITDLITGKVIDSKA